MNSEKVLLILGGSGNLGFLSKKGSSIVSVFKESWKVINVDLIENKECYLNIILDRKALPQDQLSQIEPKLNGLNAKLNCLVCVAGGWTGGSITEQEIFTQIDDMQRVNLYPALMGLISNEAGILGAKYLAEEGFMVLTGAALPFKKSTPEMIAYSISKCSTHKLAENLAESNDFPKGFSITTILPFLPLISEVIDTPQNRMSMPNSDFTRWTKPESIASLIKMWAENINRPSKGAFVLLKNVNGIMIPEIL